MPADGEGWDVHAHLVPTNVVEVAAAGCFGLGVEGDRLLTPSIRVPLGRIDDAGALTSWVGDRGLQGAIVAPPPPLFRPDLTGAERRAWTATVNDGLADACTHHPTLRPLAYVPAEDPDLAVEVVMALDESWAGVTAGTELGPLAYSDPVYEGLWESLAARGLPLFLHPGLSPDDRLERFYLTNLLGNAHETAVAAAHVVFGDVFGRHPTLRLVLAHGGGATAALVGRWQRGVDGDRPGVPSLTLGPREAVRRFFVDTLVHDPSYLGHVASVFGDGSLLFGSDWPFPMGSDRVDLEGLTPGQAHQVLVDNPRTAYRI